jgi:hypothetical protein
MAKAYLGKISALVTANTSDFNSKLNASAKEVRSFASAMQSSLTQAEQAASTSLRGIYTESQKVSRALQAVASQRLSFKGFDTSTFASLGQAVEQFKKIQNAAVQVNEPLSAAARTIEKLSASVQLAFDPALKSSQKSAEYLSAALARGGIVGEKSFERIRLKAEQAAQAADRLAEASAIAGSGPRGTELAFQDPRLRDSLAASADVRRQAQNAPAGTLADGSVGRLVQQLSQLDQLAVKIRAEIESQKVLKVDTASAEKRLSDVLLTSERVRGRLSEAVVGDPVEAGRQELGRKIGNSFLNVITPAEAAADTVEAQAQALGRKIGNALLNVITPAEAAADTIEAQTQALGRKIGNGYLTIITPAEAAADTIEAQSQALGRKIGDGYLTVITPAEAAADTIESRTQALGRRIGNSFLNVLTQAEADADTVVGRARASRQEIARTFLRSAGGIGTPGLSLGIDRRTLDGLSAQIELVQSRLSSLAAEARGPVVSALDALRVRAAELFQGGTIDTDEGRRELAALREEIVRTLAAADPQLSQRKIRQLLTRVGDIGRGAFGNIGLGVQQAVFAIEDFFSVTGGLDQRIRAAGNNISQLGFVLGGTNGLIAGVAVTITAQLIAAYIKWQNASVGTEDRLRSLNDALARQKSLVEDLAGAFRAIADEIGRIGFSKPGADAAQFQKQLDDIRKKQREFNQEQAAALDPAVQRERGIIAAREAQLQRAEDPGERIRLGLDINDARNRERQALDRINSRPGISAADAAVTAVNARLAIDEAQLRENASRAGQGAGGAQRRAEVEIEELRRRAEQDRAAAVARVAGLPRGQASQQEANRIRAQRDDLNREIQANSGFFGFDESAANAERRRQVVALTETILLLEQDVATAAANNLEIKVSKSAIAAAKQIGLAQGKVADAIEAGVPGAVGLQTQLDGLTERLQEAQSELAGAQQRARESGSGGDLQAAQKAQEEVRKIQDAINARDLEVKAVDVARRSVEAFSKALDAAVQEAQSNLQQSQSAADEARRQDLGFSTPATRQARAQADADLERQRALAADVDVEVAGARERFQQQVQQAQELRRRGEAAQAAVNADSALDGPMRAAGVNRAGATTYGDLAAKARELGNEKLAEQIEQTDLEVARASAALGLGRDNLWAGIREAIAEYEAVVNSAASEAERSLSRVSEIDAALGSTGVLAPGAREELTRERARLEARAIEADDAVRRARDESTREAERAGAAARGRGLSMTDGARAAEDLSRGLDDIRQFFGRQAEEGNGLVDFRAQAEAQRRLAEQSMRQTAPAIFGLADQVQNAVLQGPSRAALQATDVSTVQGASELNRLLRGDDSARNQNLVELQKQSASLSELVAIAKANGAPPGIFD